jgi:large-conductance mechanosensitive channel
MTHQLPQRTKRFSRKGMTFVEIMFAMIIGTAFVLIIAQFSVDIVRSSLRSQSNAQNDLTEWGIYQGITVDTRTANGMALFKTFSNAADFADVSMEIPTLTDVALTRGDFLVLTQTTEVPSAPSTPNFNTTVITGYIYTDGTPANSGKGIFQKFTYAVPSAERGNSLETILTAHKSTFAANLTTLATGLTATHSDNATTSPTNRAFMIRSTTLRSGMLNLSVSTGNVSTRTNNEKLIETAFFIRN